MNRQLVFIHGWGFEKNIWDGFIKDYFCSDNVVTIDVFSLFDENLDVKQLLENVCREINKKIVDGALVVGWSLGGMIAIRLASMFPEKQIRLFLMCSNPCFIKKPDWPYGIDKQLLISMSEDIQKNKTKTLNKFYRLITFDGDKCSKTYNDIKAASKSNTVSSAKLIKGLQLLIDIDCRDELQKLDQNITFCLAENDPLISKKLYMDKAIHNQKMDYYLFEESDHLPFISQAADCARQIKKNL